MINIRLPLDKIKYIALWMGILMYLIFSLSFTEEKRKNTICSNIQVRVVDSLKDRFVTEESIRDYIHDLDMKVLGEPVKLINTRKLEEHLSEREEIRQAEVYFTADGNLHLEIDQRNPIVRVVNESDRGYYIDDEGAIIPLSSGYSSHVLVASGEITGFFEVARMDRMNCLENKDGKEKYSVCEIFELARFINGDPFWESQIEQIYRNREGEYELIPRVGSHLISLGEFEGYRQKFRNLRAFYKKGLNQVGWNQYLKISLKYDNQIICTKK